MEFPNELAKKIFEISGQNVYSCMQCGKCSAGCPNVDFMDVTPNQVIHMIQVGDENVLHVKTPWVCANCLTCTIRCPRDVDLAAIMEALRHLSALRAGIYRIDLNKVGKEGFPQIVLVAVARKYTL